MSFFLTASAQAENYRWVDERGVLHFSDSPAVKTAKKAEKADAEGDEASGDIGLYDFRERVEKVIGVDRVQLESGKIVKYIGVKDPSEFLMDIGEVKKGENAYSFHADLVNGKTVTVLLGRRHRDNNGQYLGHVFLGQDIFLNAEMIRSGYALTEDYPSDFEYHTLFIRLQKDAWINRRGIWDFK